MNRRQFIAGASGLAASVSAIVGSGAFSTVSGKRNVSVNVATDQQAYLTLNGISNNYSEDGDVIAFDFDGDIAPSAGGTFDETGEGVGANSVYEFTELLQVQNQGTDPIVVFGEYSGDDLVSLELIAEGRQTSLTKSDPSRVIDAPGDFIRVGFRMETGDISPQEIQTEISIVGISEDSELYPNVFPQDGK